MPAAALAVRLIHGLGGYSVYSPRTSLSPAGALPRHLALAFQGVLELFGAGFAGQRPGLAVLFAVAHLAGLALAVLALGLAIGRFFRWEELVIPAFATAIILNLAAYIISVTPVNIRSTREIASVLPFGAVLAGRLLACPILQAAGRLRAANRLARADRPEGADRPPRAGRRSRSRWRRRPRPRRCAMPPPSATTPPSRRWPRTTRRWRDGWPAITSRRAG